MKYLFYSSVIFSIYSCGAKTQKHSLNSQIKGAWFVSNINKSNKDISQFTALQFSELLKNKAYANLFYFTDSGTVKIDTGGLSFLPGTYQINDSIILMNCKEYNFNITLTKPNSDDTLKMFLYENLNSNGSEKRVYKFNRITNPHLQSVEWKKPLLPSTTDRTIKAKLKELLNYYSDYYLMLGQSDINMFNHDELYLPIRLYDGGVGMRNYKEVKGFIEIMGSEENAKKAYEFLKKGFINPYKYPEHENLLLEYAEVLNHISKEI